MNEFLKKLISISSPPLGSPEFKLESGISRTVGKLANELKDMLALKNGFYAFESALHVLPIGQSQHMTLEKWNSKELWVCHYDNFIKNTVFFAEDIFGCQFCIHNEQIFSFDPETAELEYIADNLGQWAKIILEDYDVWTGFSLAQEWQETYGPIPIDSRLMPKIPFVCQGEFNLSNLVLINTISSMKTRANLAKQIINLDDGTEIKFKAVP